MKFDDSSGYIKSLVSEGEHLHQDFKFEISDARKIAKSLSAFANTSGGRLLVGVKDNGKIAGIHSDEEAYMIEAAANVYCRPNPVIEMKSYVVDGKTVLVAEVFESDLKPVFAFDVSGKKIAYVRVDDENIVASPVHLDIWKQERSEKGSLIKLTGAEKLLIELLDEEDMIDIRKFSKAAGIPRYKAVGILAKFVRFGIVETVFLEHKFFWKRILFD